MKSRLFRPEKDPVLSKTPKQYERRDSELDTIPSFRVISIFVFLLFDFHENIDRATRYHGQLGAIGLANTGFLARCFSRTGIPKSRSDFLEIRFTG